MTPPRDLDAPFTVEDFYPTLVDEAKRANHRMAVSALRRALEHIGRSAKGNWHVWKDTASGAIGIVANAPDAASQQELYDALTDITSGWKGNR